MSRTRSRRLKFALAISWFIFILIAIATTNLPTSWGDLPLQSAEIQLQHNPEADSLPESEFQQEFRVSPQDPGYLAIKSLIKRYGCMSPYSDGHLGSRVELIRSELVVDLVTCLDRAHDMVAARLSVFAVKNQIASVKSRLNKMAYKIQRLKRKSHVSK